MAELRRLSDSGVYRTISLSKIEAASTQEGVFHYNVFLKLELSSPHLKSGEPTAVFDVLVMRHLEDGTFSFAIDEFPEMNEDAIEMFWIEKVERHREMRDEAFKQIEEEARGHSGLRWDSNLKNPHLSDMDSDDLLQLLASEDDTQRRAAALRVVDARWASSSKHATVDTEVQERQDRQHHRSHAGAAPGAGEL